MAKSKVSALKQIDYPKQEETALPATGVTVAPEQLKYATLLMYGAWSGIVTLAATFFLYMSGAITSFIPPSQMPQYWGMKASKYLELTGAPHGFGWAGMLGYGDYMNYIGLALLGTLTIAGYLILLPAYLKKKDRPYTVIVVAEILVLSLAASGILKVGGH